MRQTGAEVQNLRQRHETQTGEQKALPIVVMQFDVMT
jgi:hypothetical protein